MLLSFAHSILSFSASLFLGVSLSLVFVCKKIIYLDFFLRRHRGRPKSRGLPAIVGELVDDFVYPDHAEFVPGDTLYEAWIGMERTNFGAKSLVLTSRAAVGLVQRIEVTSQTFHSLEPSLIERLEWYPYCGHEKQAYMQRDTHESEKRSHA